MSNTYTPTTKQNQKKILEKIPSLLTTLELKIIEERNIIEIFQKKSDYEMVKEVNQRLLKNIETKEKYIKLFNDILNEI